MPTKRKTTKAPERSGRRHTMSGDCWCRPEDLGLIGGLRTWKHTDSKGTQLISERRRQLTVEEARAELGENLRQLRESAGYNKREFAQAVGIGKENYVYMIESGRSAPSIGMMQTIAELYGLTVDDLLGDTRFPKRGT